MAHQWGEEGRHNLRGVGGAGMTCGWDGRQAQPVRGWREQMRPVGGVGEAGT